MLSLRNINPMVRAVGTMSAVAALVGGITFADLSSNVVALSPNNITTATASLLIGPGGCGSFSTSTTGIQDSSLSPGSSTPATPFCLYNNGTQALTLTASIPQDLSGSTAASYTTLAISCATEGNLSGALNAWAPETFPVSLAAGATDRCTATASLSTSYTGSGGENIPGFSVDFVGNQ